MKWIEVRNAGPLHGSVAIPGSKNSSLALLSAACLADEPVTLKGIPDILDIRVLRDIMSDIGVQTEKQPNGDIIINPESLHSGELNQERTSAYRASYYLIGALLAKTGRVSIGYPGGDNFVSRPIDQHIKALKAFGAAVEFHEGYYVVEAAKLHGAPIYFDTITSGATIHAMLLAARAHGETVLRHAAKDPEVVDTARLLSAMGAKISGAGTDAIHIKGVSKLGGCEYTVIPDRLIAGSFLMSAGLTSGKVTVEEVIPEHLESCLSKLKELGLSIEQTESSVTAYGSHTIRAARVRTGMFPSFATDLQQPLTALLLQARGRSIVTDKIYPERFSHIPQLRRMGAQIDVRGGSAFIRGGVPLKGALVHATDVRAGTCLMMAGMAAEGITVITGVEHIERGYENAIGLFQRLGADIRLHEGAHPMTSTLRDDAASAD